MDTYLYSRETGDAWDFVPPVALFRLWRYTRPVARELQAQADAIDAQAEKVGARTMDVNVAAEIKREGRETVQNGIANIADGAYGVADFFIFGTIDAVCSAPSLVFDYNWRPLSRYGRGHEQAIRYGVDNEFRANFLANTVTFGLYGIGQGIHQWAQTGDPSQFQQALGGFIGGGILTRGTIGLARLAGVIRRPPAPVTINRQHGLSFQQQVARHSGPTRVNP